MILKTFVFLFLCINIINAVRYDCFTAEEASAELIEKYDEANILETCTNDIEPCDPLEVSRLDGSCNNLKYPSYGTVNTNQYRLLPADVDADEKKAKCGEKLPSPRPARLEILADGKASNPLVTQLFSYFLVGFFADIIDFHGSKNDLTDTTNCCTPEGESEELCAPLEVNDDDFVHQFTDVRCMHLTKPLTFQYFGCADNETDPSRVINATSIFDLSQIYNYDGKMLKDARTFTGGQLKHFKDKDGKIWAPNAETPENCYANDENESRCNGPIGNDLLGNTLMSTWLWRMHIKIAKEMQSMNQCWNDDKLFKTTRQILTAMVMQIAMYEFWPLAMGKPNMINAGIISPLPLYRDPYNPTVKPQISTEFLYASRWFHTVQEGIVKMYDEDGVYIKQIPIVNLTSRFGYLTRDNHISYITQGAIKQPGGEFDHIVDPYISQVGLGSHQLAVDIPAFDLAKGRLNRLQGYMKYREYCDHRKHATFDDLASLLDPGRLLILKQLYKDPEDIDLMAGLWSEKLIPGGLMPYTLYCIYVEQFLRIVKSDRHWYERPNRPHAFNPLQLTEIRKMTMSRLLCDVGDSIKKIQPMAFLQTIPGNPVISCDLIPKVNLLAWKDPNC